MHTQEDVLHVTEMAL